MNIDEQEFNIKSPLTDPNWFLSSRGLIEEISEETICHILSDGPHPVSDVVVNVMQESEKVTSTHARKLTERGTNVQKGNVRKEQIYCLEKDGESNERNFRLIRGKYGHSVIDC